MFVKDRTGRTRAVDVGYVLRDGESISVAMTTFDAAPLVTPVAVMITGDHSPLANAARRNGPPVIIKDTGPERSAEFAAGAAFASQELYQRRVADAWRNSDTAPLDHHAISDVASIDPATGQVRTIR